MTSTSPSAPSSLCNHSDFKMQPIPGHEGKYMATSDGRIFSQSRAVGCRGNKIRFMKGRWLKQQKNGDGYPTVMLGSKNRITVHKLVAKTFLQSEPARPYVNHKDGQKEHNCTKNLEWCTASENTRHAIATGLLKLPGAKLNLQQVKEVKQRHRNGQNANQISKLLGIPYSTIADITRGNSWKEM